MDDADKLLRPLTLAVGLAHNETISLVLSKARLEDKHNPNI
jgi:hypothetical protein